MKTEEKKKIHIETWAACENEYSTFSDTSSWTSSVWLSWEQKNIEKAGSNGGSMEK